MPTGARLNNCRVLRHEVLVPAKNTQNMWAQTGMTTQAMDLGANGTREPKSLRMTASQGLCFQIRVRKQLLEFFSYGLLEYLRRGADKLLRIERCTLSNDISCRLQVSFNLMRNRVNLTSNEISRDGPLGPTFGCERAHHQNTIDKQGLGFFKPRPCGSFDRWLPLVQHKMRRACHSTCRHDGLKF